jgi:hypothetical protein
MIEEVVGPFPQATRLNLSAHAPADPRTPSSPVTFRILLAALYLAGLGAVAWFAWQGASYYATPIGERARHELYWDLKPGGTLGLRFGVLGLAMMTLMHGYSARKRLPFLRKAGALRRWLDVHILLGVLGPLFVVLHSSFKVSGLVAISFWSMAAVALSGVFGRYLYLQIPRTRAGEEITLAEVLAEDAALAERLRSEFGVEAGLLERLEQEAHAGLLADLVPLRGRRVRRLARSVPGVPPHLAKELGRVMARKVALRRRILLWDALHRVFHHWHVVHKPFAVVMYLFVIVHVAVASLTGYGLAWP